MYFIKDIYEKDLIAILHLLVAVIRYFKVPINLPENITVKVIIIQVRKINFFIFSYLFFFRKLFSIIRKRKSWKN